MSPDSQASSGGRDIGFSDRNLLYGIMALRVGFIQPEQLIATLQTWVDSNQESIEYVLVRLGYLTQSDCALLTPIVNEFIQRHGGDARVGLSALSPIGELREPLNAIDDADLQASLSHIRRINHQLRAEATRTWTGNDERFRILNFHRQGGLGKVSVAFDNELGREVAFKEIRDEYANVQSFRDRFLVEAEITGRLEHPGIVPVYGLGHYPDGRPFYAMRFIRGNSFQSAIRQFHTKEYESLSQRRLDLRKLIERFLDVCEAVEYAHNRGVLHRDLKPGNIMLGRYGETLVVDWGLAKSVARTHSEDAPNEDTLRPRFGSSAASRDGVAIGSPSFMSPEQALGQLDILSPATDVFGLGATLYCLLTGRPPYESDSGEDEILEKAKQGHIVPPHAIAANVPVRLSEICMKAMAFRIEERYQSAGELREDIWSWLTDEPLSAFHAVVKHFEELHDKEPEVIPFRLRLARELANFSKVYQSMERFEEARNSAQRAVNLLDEVHAAHQLNLALFQELYFSRAQLSSVLRASGMAEDAQNVERINQDQFKYLLKSLPVDHSLRQELFGLFLHQGFSLDESKKLHAAASNDSLFGTVDRVENIRSIGTYEIIQEIARDGFGIVYTARHASIDRIVALKVFRSELFTLTDQFYAAARAVILLDHPGIVSIYEYGETEGIFFISMAYVAGSNLADTLKSGPLVARKAAELLQKVCVAIGHAHERGVIHRDLKPSNILLDRNGQPKVTGFELAKMMHVDDPKLETGAIVGTLSYMAPEQARGETDDVGPPADVYALGGILYCMLTGRPPFLADSATETISKVLNNEPIPPRELNPDVPLDLERMCLKCLSKNSSQRYATANVLGEELKRYLLS